MGLRIELDTSNGFVLDQIVKIDLLLKEFGMESANGRRTSNEAKCSMDDVGNKNYLPARSAKGDSKCEAFSVADGKPAMDSKMHASRH